MPGHFERSGVWGPCRGPHVQLKCALTEKRHGCAGPLRTFGGLGAISGPPCSTEVRADREAARPCRAAWDVWGIGGHFRAQRVTADGGEARLGPDGPSAR